MPAIRHAGELRSITEYLQKKKVAEETPIARCPRTDPNERNYCTDLPLRLYSREARIGTSVQVPERGNPKSDKPGKMLPRCVGSLV